MPITYVNKIVLLITNLPSNLTSRQPILYFSFLNLLSTNLGTNIPGPNRIALSDLQATNLHV